MTESPAAPNLWPSVDHALAYLAFADRIPHRTEGEAALLELLPVDTSRVLDLGCGDGRLLALVRTAFPIATGVAADFSPAMLDAAQARFADDPAVEVIDHDLDETLPELGLFDAVVSSFAIHHVADARKRALYAEVAGLLRPGGVFANLEHVSSTTDAIHLDFLAALGTPPDEEDPSNQTALVEPQLTWLREAGLDDVDCFWKWRELALLAGTRPAGS